MTAPPVTKAFPVQVYHSGGPVTTGTPPTTPPSSEGGGV